VIKDRTVDATEFAELYRVEAPRLWRAMLAFTANPEVASDVVAEAFAQCLRRGSAVRAPALWLWKAAFRIASGELLDGKRASTWHETSTEHEMPDLDLMLALGRLSPRQRLTVILHYYAGYSTPEIAGIASISAATVRVHLMQARRRLREELGDIDE
jgi:RNA polymerase sigma-70 factor (ECF subfamily)